MRDPSWCECTISSDLADAVIDNINWPNFDYIWKSQLSIVTMKFG